jgi:hypothetical protein
MNPESFVNLSYAHLGMPTVDQVTSKALQERGRGTGGKQYQKAIVVIAPK